MEDDILERYRREAAAAMEEEAKRRIAESVNPDEEERLRNLSLNSLRDSEHLVPALLSRLGMVRSALDGHGGGIAVSSIEDGLDLILDLTGACLSCGAAPGTLQGIKNDLEKDPEIARIRFDSSLLDTFDELGREFILAHGQVEFVNLAE